MSVPLVEMRDIRIAFGGVRAVDGVSIDLHAGEVVGLLGHNGAGKSTLIKILSGAYKADSGELRISGQPVDSRRPRAPPAPGRAARENPRSSGAFRAPTRPTAGRSGSLGNPWTSAAPATPGRRGSRR